MAGFFSKLKGTGPNKPSKTKKAVQPSTVDEPAPSKQRWTDAWTRTSVDPDEVHEVLHHCTLELKARGTFCIYLS